MIPIQRPTRQSLYGIIIYSTLVLMSGWIGRWIDAFTGNTPGHGPGITLWIFAPLGISFLIRAFSTDNWGDLGIKPAFRKNVSWYMVSIFILPVCFSVILFSGYISNTTCSDPETPNKAAMFLKAMLVLSGPQVLQNTFEESGFRGYLTPKIKALGWHPMANHLAVGAVWGLWHLPYLRSITPYTTMHFSTLAPCFLAGAIALSIIYGEIRVRTGSLWPAIIMQTTGGMFAGALMTNNMIIVQERWECLFNPVMEGGAAIILFLIAGIGICLLRNRSYEMTDNLNQRSNYHK